MKCSLKFFLAQKFSGPKNISHKLSKIKKKEKEKEEKKEGKERRGKRVGGEGGRGVGGEGGRKTSMIKEFLARKINK